VAKLGLLVVERSISWASKITGTVGGDVEGRAAGISISLAMIQVGSWPPQQSGDRPGPGEQCGRPSTPTKSCSPRHFSPAESIACRPPNAATPNGPRPRKRPIHLGRKAISQPRAVARTRRTLARRM